MSVGVASGAPPDPSPGLAGSPASAVAPAPLSSFAAPLLALAAAVPPASTPESERVRPAVSEHEAITQGAMTEAVSQNRRRIAAVVQSEVRASDMQWRPLPAARSRRRARLWEGSAAAG